MRGRGISREAAWAVRPPGLLPRLLPGMCAPRPRTVGLVLSPPTWTMFRQELRVLQQRPVRRMVRLLSPWAMLPRELPLVRLLLLLLRLGLLLVLVACLCALR